MVRNLCPAIQILSEFQCAEISKYAELFEFAVQVWPTLDSICGKLKLEIEPDWKARRVLLRCSACWVASSLGNVKKSTVLFFLFHGQGQRMQENLPRIEKKN